MASKRYLTNYPGVYYRLAKRIGGSGEEKVYYITFKKDDKKIEEKVGRQYANNMTPSKASGIRAERVEGKRKSRKEILAESKKSELTSSLDGIWKRYNFTKLNGQTSKTDISNYNNHLAKFKNKYPEEIITSELVELRDQLLQKGKSHQTIKNILELLRRLINFGVKNGLCPQRDVTKLQFPMPSVDNEKTEMLSELQISNLLKALDEEKDQDAASLMRLALVTGMRKGALLSLKWTDINFDKDFITLRGEVAKKGKTETIPLSETAKGILNKINKTNSEYIFPGKNGEKRTDFRRIARRVKEKAGLPDDFRPLHGLRHAYASFLASSGKVDLYTIQKLLTHSSPQMTQRYAHLANEAMKKAAGVADEIIKSK